MQKPTPIGAAWHLGAAAAGPDEQVARALEASAERARQRGGSSAAAVYLWRAAELSPDPGRASERLLEAARAELVAGHGPQAREILDRARASGLGADPLAELLTGIAACLTGEHAAISILHMAVTSAARDQARLQSVAGRHVHVVYFDTVLAAVDTLDDRAWDDLTHAWVQLSRATGALAALPLALSFRGWLEVLPGRLGSAASHLAEIEDVVSLTRSRGLLGAPAPAHVLRNAWLDDEEATRTGARRMMQDAHERGAGIGIDHAYAALSVLELGAGRYDAALRVARHIFDHDSIVLATLALPDLVEAAARCSDMDLAEQALARLSERATASGTAWARGLLARARALVANGDEADEHFRLALDELSRSTVATDTARTQLLYGEWLRRARRRKKARGPLHEALEFFETIGASGFAARARSELAATGEHVRSRSAPVNVLTPQEAQIARLAASGERNHDIAAQLCITTSTVEYHLRKIFVKLGVSSRTQLAQVDLPT